VVGRHDLHAAGDTIPENVLAAIELGMAVGADGFEFDVQLTQDQQMVAFHDATLERTTNATGKISTLRYEQLQYLNASFGFCNRLQATPLQLNGRVHDQDHYVQHMVELIHRQVCLGDLSLEHNYQIPKIDYIVQRLLDIEQQQQRLAATSSLSSPPFQTRLILEVKLGVDEEHAADALAALFERYHELHHRALVMSFSPTLLYKVRARVPQVASVLLLGTDLMSRFCEYISDIDSYELSWTTTTLCAHSGTVDWILWQAVYPVVAWWIGVGGVAPHYTAVCHIDDRRFQEACSDLQWWLRYFQWCYVWGTNIQDFDSQRSARAVVEQFRSLNVSWTPRLLPLPSYLQPSL
jgi:glycerophosphoryl diester phosphodiesterase